MAFTSSTILEVRNDTGSDSNGGGFDPTLGGTDYTYPISSPIAYTDLVIQATTTQASSAARPFTSADVGNILNIISGTGFTVQRAQIVSVASGIATFDKSLGTAASTGGTGNLGGALATPGMAASLLVNSMTVYQRSTTLYTIASTIALGGTTGVSWIGYGNTRGDNLRPLITCATNSVDIFSVTPSSGLSASTLSGSFRNLWLVHTATTRGNGFTNASGSNQAGSLDLRNILVDGCQIGVKGGTRSFANIQARSCEIKNCKSDGIANVIVNVVGCSIHGNTGNGITTTNAQSVGCVVNDSILASNGGKGWAHTDTTHTAFLGCSGNTFAYNTSDGLNVATTGANFPTIAPFVQNVFWGNGGFGINCAQTTVATTMILSQPASWNAFGGNTSGNRNNFNVTDNDVTLLSDPFINGKNMDFRINAGAGALLRGAGMVGAPFASNLDIGAVQHADPPARPRYRIGVVH